MDFLYFRKKNWQIFVGIFGVYTGVYWYKLFFRGMLPVNSDTLLNCYPWWASGKWLLREGYYFLWDPYRNMGQPYLAQPQNQGLYPVRLLSVALDFVDYQIINILFHTWLSVIGAYLFGRAHYKTHHAAILAALLMGFNGFILGRIPYTSNFAPICWVPIILFFLTTNRPILLGFSLALQWLAGYPPMFILTIILCFIFCVAFEKWKCFFVGYLLAGGLSAAQWIPFMEMLHQSIRPILHNRFSAVEFSCSFPSTIKRLFLPPNLLFKFLDSGHQLDSYYLGPLISIMFLIGIWKGSKREKILGLAGTMALILSLGTHIKIYPYIPFITIFRYPSHWLLIFTTCSVFVAIHIFDLLHKKGVKHLILLFVAFDLYFYSKQYPVIWADELANTGVSEFLPGLKENLTKGRIFSNPNYWEKIGIQTDSTVGIWDLSKSILLPSFGVGLGIREVYSNDPMQSKRSAGYQKRLLLPGANSKLFDYADVAKIIEMKREGFAKAVPSRADFRVYVNPNAKGRAFFVGHDQAIRINWDHPGDFMINSTGSGQLVFSEAYYPGWEVYVDRKPAKLEMFEHMFLSVVIPEGIHEVHFRYRPLSFEIGVCLTIITLVSILIYLIIGKRRNVAEINSAMATNHPFL